MSAFPSEDIPLFTAIRLVRLRDRLHDKGAFTADFFRGMEGEETKDKELLEAIQGKNLDEPLEVQNVDTTRISISGGKVEGPVRIVLTLRDLLNHTARRYEAIQGIWEFTFTRELNAIERFLNLLEGLHLDISFERHELNGLRDRNESILQRLATLSARIKSGKTAGDIKPILPDLFLATSDVNTLADRVNKMTDTAIRLVAVMTSSVQSNRLLELFTGEP
jgi:hypothetical protein